MKTYKVKYREVLEHEFYVEAESEEEIQENFFELASENNLDFSYGVVTSGYITEIKEV